MITGVLLTAVVSVFEVGSGVGCTIVGRFVCVVVGGSFQNCAESVWFRNSLPFPFEEG